jgi:hypothetical protein
LSFGHKRLSAYLLLDHQHNFLRGGGGSGPNQQNQAILSVRNYLTMPQNIKKQMKMIIYDEII